MSGPKISKGKLESETANAVGWVFLERLSGIVMAFVVSLILARLLTKFDYGLVRNAMIFHQFVALFKDQGMSKALIQRKHMDEADVHTAFWTSVGVTLILFAIAFVGAPFVAAFFEEPRLTDVIRWMALTIPMSALITIPTALLQKDLSYKTLALRSVVANVAGGVVGIGLALGGYGVWALVLQAHAAAIVSIFVLWTSVEWRPKMVWVHEKFLELYQFGIYILGQAMTSFASRRADDFLIAAYLGQEALGVYGIAYGVLAQLQSVLTKPIATVAFPSFSKLQHDREKLQDWFLVSTRLTFMLAGPPFLWVAITSDPLIPFVYGAKWQPATLAMRFLAVVGMVQSVLLLNGPVLNAIGKPKITAWVTVCRAITNVTAFFFVVSYGIWAVAATYLASVLFWSPLAIGLVNQNLGMPQSKYLVNLVAPSIAIAGFGGTVYAVLKLVGGPAIVSLPLSGILGMVVFVILSRVLLPSDFQLLSQLLRKRLGRLSKRWNRGAS